MRHPREELVNERIPGHAECLRTATVVVEVGARQ
jgi:hypothetical protein